MYMIVEVYVETTRVCVVCVCVIRSTRIFSKTPEFSPRLQNSWNFVHIECCRNEKECSIFEFFLSKICISRVSNPGLTKPLLYQQLLSYSTLRNANPPWTNPIKLPVDRASNCTSRLSRKTLNCAFEKDKNINKSVCAAFRNAVGSATICQTAIICQTVGPGFESQYVQIRD